MRYRQQSNFSKFSQTSCSGFSLLEMLISISTLSIALAGIISAILSGTQLNRMHEEKALARNAAEQVFSALRGLPDIMEAYDQYGGAGPNETFAVRGLQDPSVTEPAGRVIVWRLKSSLTNSVSPPQPDPGSSLILSQADILAAQTAFTSSFPNMMDMVPNATGTSWDDYVDSNNNGTVDILDVPQLLPITARIRWRSQSGMITEYFSSVIGRR